MDTLLDIAFKVCESDLVHAIQSASLEFAYTDTYEYTDKHGKTYTVYEHQIYKSDVYSLYQNSERTLLLAEGEFSEKHKVAGLYFKKDFSTDDPIRYHQVAPGLSGVRSICRIVREFLKKHNDKIPDNLEFISINIAPVWKAFMEVNCSDGIMVDLLAGTIDLSNQREYSNYESYPSHIAGLKRLLEEGFGIVDTIREWW